MSRGGVSFSVGRDHRDRDRCDQPPCSMQRPTPLHRRPSFSLPSSFLLPSLAPFLLSPPQREREPRDRAPPPRLLPRLPLSPATYREIVPNANRAVSTPTIHAPIRFQFLESDLSPYEPTDLLPFPFSVFPSKKCHAFWSRLEITGRGRGPSMKTDKELVKRRRDAG